MALKSRIPQIRARTNSAVAAGVYRAAGFVRDLAKQLAPVDEGDWRDSFTLDTNGPALTVTVQGGGAKAPHGVYVEYGVPSRPNYPAQPTLTPAARAIRPELEVAKELRAMLRKQAL
jgi:hypothetical protein